MVKISRIRILEREKRLFRVFALILMSSFVYSFTPAFSSDGMFITREEKKAKRENENQELQERFKWWPTDAIPGPVKDEERGGYWWWPTTPGKVGPVWGNRGYVYVFKIIFDYKEEELPPPKPQELRPSLLIRKIIKNVKVYFDYDKADLRDDAVEVLEKAV